MTGSYIKEKEKMEQEKEKMHGPRKPVYSDYLLRVSLFILTVWISTLYLLFIQIFISSP